MGANVILALAANATVTLVNQGPFSNNFNNNWFGVPAEVSRIRLVRIE